MSTKRRKDENELVVHIGAGFGVKERPLVRDALSTLRQHLERWDFNDVSVEVSLQDRGRREQRVTLRTILPGLTPLVAVVTDANLPRAVHDAKRELIRQLIDTRVRRPIAAPRSPSTSPGV